MEDERLVGYEQWTNLANAIIKQAADDYVHYKMRLHMIKSGLVEVEDEDDMVFRANLCRSKILKIARFFRSAWHRELTTADGQAILNGLNETYEEQKVELRNKLAKKMRKKYKIKD